MQVFGVCEQAQRANSRCLGILSNLSKHEVLFIVIFKFRAERNAANYRFTVKNTRKRPSGETMNFILEKKTVFGEYYFSNQ